VKHVLDTRIDDAGGRFVSGDGIAKGRDGSIAPPTDSPRFALVELVFASCRLVGESDNELPRSARRLYSDFVVDSTLNPLIAAEISLCCLNRNMTEQKLDLFEFASGGMAEPSTCSAEVVRR
jgi:hypothetical protein